MSDTAAGLLQVGLLLALLAAVYAPLGGYMARVYTSDKDSRIERGTYKLLGVDSKAEQTWGVYARSLIAFMENAFGALAESTFVVWIPAVIEI